MWELWAALPTQTLPQRGARPVKRLVALAQALSADAIWPGALSKVEEELHRILDAYATRYSDKLDSAIQEVWDVHVKEIEGRFGEKGLTYAEFVERADDRAIRTGFEAAKKAFGADIAQSYVNHLAGPDDEASDDDGLREAYVRAAALATVKEVRDKVDLEALELTDRLFAEHRVAIKELPDVRQQEYEDIRAMTTDPQRGVLRPPRTRIEGFSVVEEDGQIAAAPLAPLHLMSDEDGQFPLTSLNKWEREVVLAELARPNVRGWYRNPSRAAVDSLGIAYRDDDTGNWRSMHPDFVFFHEVGGKIVQAPRRSGRVGLVLAEIFGDRRRQAGLAVVDVPDRANVHMWLRTLEFTFCHRLFSLAAGPAVPFECGAISDKDRKTQASSGVVRGRRFWGPCVLVQGSYMGSGFEKCKRSEIAVQPGDVGAGSGNRTRIFSLEGCCSTTELYPHSPKRGGREGRFMHVQFCA